MSSPAISLDRHRYEISLCQACDRSVPVHSIYTPAPSADSALRSGYILHEEDFQAISVAGGQMLREKAALQKELVELEAAADRVRHAISILDGALDRNDAYAAPPAKRAVGRDYGLGVWGGKRLGARILSTVGPKLGVQKLAR